MHRRAEVARRSSVPLLPTNGQGGGDEGDRPASVQLPRRHQAGFLSSSQKNSSGECQGVLCGERTEHLTRVDDTSRFPKLGAHFHYDHVQLGPIQVTLGNDEVGEEEEEEGVLLRVRSNGQSWHLRRSLHHFRLLDRQLHLCVYDRKFSGLPELQGEEMLPQYLERFSQLAGSLINCGPVLNWLELDNRGNRLIVRDEAAINTPGVAAAYGVKHYDAQAQDEISLQVGDVVSVIDMPPPQESTWWRGKKGFQVGFFPSECVELIGHKSVPPHHLKVPTKPVLRPGKLIALLRSFLAGRVGRSRLKQSGILRERVFGCDLGEHLAHAATDVPLVLKCCSEFIEKHGVVDGIYRLSGVTSNIQKLRLCFDEERVPELRADEVHCVASLLKMYFRELPNPLLTYHLHDKFLRAVQHGEGGEEGRAVAVRSVVRELPPPHYRSLEFLVRHLQRLAQSASITAMTPKNLAIVWAPNLLRCREGGGGELQVVGVQAVLTEYLIRYTDLIFDSSDIDNQVFSTPKRTRPKSLSTPSRLLSLEEARSRAQHFGREGLPVKYHTVVQLPNRRGKKSPSTTSGWKSLFSRGTSRRQRKPRPEIGNPICSSEPPRQQDDTSNHLRTVKSAEALFSPADLTDETRGEKQRSNSHESYFTPDDTPPPPLPSAPRSQLASFQDPTFAAESPTDLSEPQTNQLHIQANQLQAAPVINKTSQQLHPAIDIPPEMDQLHQANQTDNQLRMTHSQLMDQLNLSNQPVLNKLQKDQPHVVDQVHNQIMEDQPYLSDQQILNQLQLGNQQVMNQLRMSNQMDQLHMTHPQGVEQPHKMFDLPSPLPEGCFLGDIILSPPASFVDHSKMERSRTQEIFSKSGSCDLLRSPMSPSSSWDTRRRFESEIGRTIVRDRQMRSEMERMKAERKKSIELLRKSASKSAELLDNTVERRKSDEISSETQKSVGLMQDSAKMVSASKSVELLDNTVKRRKSDEKSSATQKSVELMQDSAKLISASKSVELLDNSVERRKSDEKSSETQKSVELMQDSAKLISASKSVETERLFGVENGRLESPVKFAERNEKSDHFSRTDFGKSLTKSVETEEQLRRKSPVRFFKSESDAANEGQSQRSPMKSFESSVNDLSRLVKSKPSVRELLSKFEGKNDSNVFSNVQVVNHDDSQQAKNSRSPEHMFQTECVIRFPQPKSKTPADDPPLKDLSLGELRTKGIELPRGEFRTRDSYSERDPLHDEWMANTRDSHSEISDSRSNSRDLSFGESRSKQIELSHDEQHSSRTIPHGESRTNSKHPTTVERYLSRTIPHGESRTIQRDGESRKGGSFSSFAETFRMATAQMRNEFFRGGPSPPEVRRPAVATRPRPRSVPPPVCRLSCAPPSTSHQVKVKEKAAMFERSFSFGGGKERQKEEDSR